MLDSEPLPLCEQLQKTSVPDQVAQSRSTSFRALGQRLRGDLERIVGKALAKHRTDRYSSAAELAKDIESYLQLRPTSVAPSSAVYHFRKFIQRNKVLSVAAVLVVAALMLGTVFATLGYLQAEASRKLAEENGARANRERAEALRQREQAMQFAARLEELVGLTNPERGVSVDFTVREMLDRFASSMEANNHFEDSPDVKASLLRTVGRSYLTLRDLKNAEPFLRQALDTRQRIFGADHPLLLESQVDYANYLFFANDHVEAGIELDRILEALYRQAPGPLIVQALTLRSGVAGTQRRLGQAAYFASEAWMLSSKVHGENASITLQQKARLAQYAIRGSLDSQTALEAGETMAREAHDMTVRCHPDAPYDLAMAHWQFGGSLVYLGKYEEAETIIRKSLALHRELLGEASSYVVRDLTRLSFICLRLGDIGEARELALEAVRLGEASTFDRERILHRAYGALLRVSEPDSQEEADVLGKQIEVVKILENQPHRLPRMLWQRAMLLEKLGQQDLAIASLKEAIQVAEEQDRVKVASQFRADLNALMSVSPDLPNE